MQFTLRKQLKIVAIIATLIVAAMVSFVIVRAVGSNFLEAESGSRSNGVLMQTDSLASGGSSISFSDPSTVSPNCGLAGAVFCEDFESGPTANRGRSGDFTVSRLSGGRQQGTTDPGFGPNYIRRADIPACRIGSVANPLPPDDMLVCDPVASRNTRHALISGTSQNYGDDVVRVNQPFDFASRVGKIRTDVSLDGGNGNGSPEMVFSDQPIAVASIMDENGAGTSLSNGFIIHFRLNCSPGNEGELVRIYNNYTESQLSDEFVGTNNCSSQSTVQTSPGKLNRVELRISQSKFEIWATDYSNDGVTFGALKRVFSSVPINLSFLRGWYSFGAHNHATIKYENRISENVYFDNVAFDGPALAPPTVYQILDNTQADQGGIDLGWPFKNRNETLMPPLTFNNVNTAGITTAQIAFNVYIDAYNSLTNRLTYYRLNGGAWHQYPVLPGMLANDAGIAHRTMFVIDINKSELVSGNNTIQFSSDNLWNGVDTYVSNVDLLVWN